MARTAGIAASVATVLVALVVAMGAFSAPRTANATDNPNPVTAAIAALTGATTATSAVTQPAADSAPSTATAPSESAQPAATTDAADESASEPDASAEPEASTPAEGTADESPSEAAQPAATTDAAADEPATEPEASTPAAGPNAAPAASVELKDRVTNFSFVWSTDNSENLTLSNGNKDLLMAPIKARGSETDFPAGTYAKAVLSFDVRVAKDEPTQQIPANSLNIALPAYIFQNRDGGAQGGYYLGLSGEGDSDLTYAYNDHGTPDNKFDDTIDITNKSAITRDSTHYKVEVTYSSIYSGQTPSPANPVEHGIDGDTTDIKGGSNNSGGYERSGIRASLSVADQGGATYATSSEGMKVTYQTSNQIDELTNMLDLSTFGFIRANYDAEWWTSRGEQVPADADQYFYVAWRISAGGSGSQESVHKLTGSSTTGGEVVAWSVDQTKSWKTPAADGSLTLDKDYLSVDNYSFVLVRYSKDLLVDGSKVRIDLTLTDSYTGEDGYVTKKDVPATYEWDYKDFKYPDNINVVAKSTIAGIPSYNSKQGLIDVIESAEEGATVLGGGDKPSIVDSNRAIWRMYAENTAGRLTFEKNYDFSNVDYRDAGKRSYTVDLIDDFVGLNGKRLGVGDYEISYLGFEFSRDEAMIAPDETGMGEAGHVRRPLEEWPEVTVYYETELDNQWKELGVLKCAESSGAFTFTYAETGETLHNTAIKMPSGAVGVRFSYSTNSGYSKLWIGAEVSLKASKNVKSIVQGLDETSLANINTMYVRDADGKQAALNETPGGPEAYRDQLVARDAAALGAGNYARHYDSYYKLTRTKPESVATIYAPTVGADDDKANNRVTVKYKADGAESVLNDASADLTDLKKLGFHEQREGTFYVLLPPGVTADESTVKVWKKDSLNEDKQGDYYASNPDKHTSVPSITSFEENWRGSGRTMLVVRAILPEGQENACRVWRSWHQYDWYGHYYQESGFRLEFDAYYPGDAYNIYGNSLSASMAYRSAGELSQAFADTGGSLADASLMADLDNNGNPANEPANVQYAEVTRQVAFTGSSQVSTGKFVRASGGLWGAKASLRAGQSYGYLLERAGKGNSIISDIVMYDSLESYSGPEGTSTKLGTIDSIDASQPIRLGAQPTYYYSTASGLDLTSASSADRDLTNAAIWTKATDGLLTGVDKSKVTAVAVSLGKSFQLEGADKSARVVVNMKAPARLAQTTVARNVAYISSSEDKAATGVTALEVVPNVASFSFTKRSGAEADAAGLSGATFRLWRWDGSDESYPEGPIDASSPGSGWVDAGTVTSGPDGSVSYASLVEGTYRLVETKAPDGFLTPKGQWKVQVVPNLSTANKVLITSVLGEGGEQPPAFQATGSGADEKLNLPNYLVAIMPTSGATGTALMTAAGLALVAVAGGVAWCQLRAGEGDRPSGGPGDSGPEL